MELPIKIHDVWEGVVNGSIPLSELSECKEQFNDFLWDILLNKSEYNPRSKDNLSNIRDLIMIYLDYYTYSEDGDVLITDGEYDELMNYYISLGGSLITHSDVLNGVSKWEFVKHESPGIVGSVEKIYNFPELQSYLSKYRCSTGRSFRIAPKFDGVSSAIKFDCRGKILMGVTRNDGVEGQNITEVARRAWNVKEVGMRYSERLKTGETVWVKTEICISMSDFDKLKEEKEYKNRRSGTSGIVNSPKNLHLAKYLTIIPLATHFPSSDDIDYHPMGSKDIYVPDPESAKGCTYVMDEIEQMLSSIRDSHYPFRTDGVIVYPLGEDIIPNYDDIMDHAIAYKVNTAEALTQVEYAYVSVGRLGNAIPMVHVHPTEINEICAHDASLGSFDKFAGMDIHEGEQVIIYAGGDVIPLIRLPDVRHYPADAPLLKIKKRCPYCHEKLTRHKNSYRCENPHCDRINAGRIANFLVKLGAYGISDQTVQDLYEADLIKDIPDLFQLSMEDISKLDRYGEQKARNILDEIERIRSMEISESQFLGSLGIPGIMNKKARMLLSALPLKKGIHMKKKKAITQLLDAENVGEATASTYIDFLHDNESMIQELLSVMNIVTDKRWIGNVVFTGFRNAELEAKFNSIGYEVSSNVNRNTVAVVDSSFSHDSTKCKAARGKGIDIVHVSEADLVINELKKRRDL